MPQNPFDALVVQSRDLFVDRLCAAVEKMLAGANTALTDLADKAEDQEAKKLLLAARDVANTRRAAMEKQFRTRLLAEFQKRTNKARKLGTSLADITLDQLELVGEDDLNETLRFNDMAARLRRFCEEELSALDQRVGVLLGDAALESDDNPFGPPVICDAYKQACRHVSDEAGPRAVLLKLFDDHVLDTIRSSYKGVNELLVQNGILPKIRYGISKSESKAPPAPGAAPGDKAAPAEPEKPEDMFAMIQKMLAPIAQGPPPAPGMGVGNVPLVQGAELMGSLTRIQTGDFTGVTSKDGADLSELLAAASGMTNVLKELKTSSVGASMGQVDAMTLDIVSMLFDELFEDPKVPIALKGLLGRLQLPMLKVALADKELFTKKTHPARKLIDALGQIGMRLPADFDETSPLFGRLERFIQLLVESFQEKVEVFDEVRAELEEIIAEYDHKVVEEMEASAEQLRRSEGLAVAKAAAQEEIAARVHGKDVPAAVTEFLAKHWIKYPLIMYARHGKDSDAWKESLVTVDQLLWSLEPKPTMEERRQLAKTIPSLLKGLRAGAEASGISPDASATFYAHLMKCHTDIMQAPPPKKDATGRPKDLTALVKKATSPPAEDTLDFTGAVVVPNPFGEGPVEVVSEDLDFTAAAPLETTPIAAEGEEARPRKKRETVPLPARLVEGAWVKIIGADNEAQPARLHYVSPMRSHFLFVDRKGHKVFECSRTVLARRLDALEIEILDGEPDVSLFDRILDSLFGKLGTRPPAPA